MKIVTEKAIVLPDHLIRHLAEAEEEIVGVHGGYAGAAEVIDDGAVVGVLAYFPGATLSGLQGR